jgi:hypothetical protein
MDKSDAKAEKTKTKHKPLASPCKFPFLIEQLLPLWHQNTKKGEEAC